jgi:hypothetical protein
MEQFVRYVRRNTQYGTNDFIDNGDGTITDLPTGLIWQGNDSGVTLDWEESLNYCERLDFVGFDDWHLPNTKELQSIVDYTRSPQTTNSAAIDPIFAVSEIESWYWTSTTHLDNGVRNAVYIAFGQAFGLPNGNLVDVHGAGAQRSDPKSGDPTYFSEGRGTEGQDDQVRIYNYARCVRDGISSKIFVGGEVDEHSEIIAGPDTLENQKNSDLGPPQEAISACDSLIVGSSCSFTAPQGDISGFCRIVKNNTMACVPKGSPPGGNPATKP